MEPLLDKRDLARILRVRTGTVEVRLSRRPHLLPQPIWIGGQAYWRPETVAAWLQSLEAAGKHTETGKGGPGRPRNPR